MKKIILLVFLLSLGLATKVANADFIFGEPVNLGPPINTPSGEVNFFLSADGLEVYISSDRSGGLGYIDMWRITRENTDNPWGLLVNVQEINSRYNEAFPCLSADGLTLYFADWYSWNAAGDRPGGVGNHDLWMCTRLSTHNPWGPPVNMGAIINSPNDEVSPSVSQDGKILIFASNRSGGLGNYDLWMSTRPSVQEAWGPPVNMGPAVNSSAYDGEVCLSTDGMALFFCSDRPGGSGGYDLWMCNRPSVHEAWGPPVNLGSVINTSYTEAAPSLSPDLKTLYFVSDQPGGIGGWDIYEVPIVPILDFNGDGIVDSADMLIMVDYWGTGETLCDIAPPPFGDGIVDVQDLIVLAEHLRPVFLAHWELDETEGGIAYNSVGDHDGTLNGNPLWQPAGGKLNGALQLDGIDDYVSTPFILDPSKGSISAFAWIKGGAPRQVIISQIGVFGGTWLGTNSSEGKLMTGLSDMYFGALESESVITDGQWHHVGLVYDLYALHRHLYLDGVEVTVDSDYVAGVPSDGGLYIGTGKAMEPGTFWSGLIDDVRIYNRALNTEEIAALAR